MAIWNKAILTSDSCQFTNGKSFNSITANGAIFFGNQPSIITIDHATVTGNSASGTGGGVYAANGVNLTVQNSVLSSNTARSGGAVWGAANLTNNVFSKNSATVSGGAIGGTHSQITNCIFTSNKGNQDGGAIASGSASIKLCVFKNNSASSGGALALESGQSQVEFSSFEANTATSNGGAVLITNGQSTTSSCTFEGNQASSGGAIYLFPNGLDVTATVNQCTFNKNLALFGGGGAILLSASNVSKANLTINNSTIYGNTSSGGAGVRRSSTRTVLEINSCIIAGNLSGSTTPGRDIYSDSTSTLGGNNSLFGSTTSIGFTLSGVYQGGNDTTPLDPMLNPLADNGGRMLPDGNRLKTMAVQAGSPALFKGNNSLGFVYDQRGPGFLRHGSPFTTVGAFEYLASTPVAKIFSAPRYRLPGPRITPSMSSTPMTCRSTPRRLTISTCR